jgi:thiamine biosynthesis lipoprotein
MMIDDKLATQKQTSAHLAQADWHHHAFRAMNTEVYLWLYGRNGGLARYTEQHFARFEQRLSRFKADSELAQLNRRPCTECPVSPELYAALEVAFWAAQATNGLYDPTILPALINAGYDRSFDLLEGKLA